MRRPNNRKLQAMINRCARASAAFAIANAALNNYCVEVYGFEPGDSRAVSNEFVALAAVSCGMPDTDGAYARIIGEALARLREAADQIEGKSS